MMNTLLTIAFQVNPDLDHKLAGGTNNELLIWISLFAGLIALGLGVYVFVLLNRLKKSNGEASLASASKTDNQPVFVTAAADEGFKVTLEQRLGELEQRLYLIENPPRTKEWSSKDIAVAKPEVQVRSSKPVELSKAKKQPAIDFPEFKQAAEVLAQSLFYAKLPDLKSAFSEDVLVNAQNGEQVYEIKLKDEHGTYAISQDIDAQKYAFSDVNYYLSAGCEFLNQPAKDSWIINKSEGKLVKSDGNWVIQEKAVIEFR